MAENKTEETLRQELMELKSIAYDLSVDVQNNNQAIISKTRELALVAPGLFNPQPYPSNTPAPDAEEDNSSEQDD